MDGCAARKPFFNRGVGGRTSVLMLAKRAETKGDEGNKIKSRGISQDPPCGSERRGVPRGKTGWSRARSVRGRWAPPPAGERGSGEGHG